MAEYEKKGEDRISELTESLLHDILSRISIKDVARTCILSKRWKYIWETFPFLNFDEEKFYFSHQNTSSVGAAHWKNAHLMKKAKQMVLSRCQEKNPTLLKLFWVIPEYIISGIRNSNLQLNTFIPNLANTRLQELSIINNYRFGFEEYLKLPSSPLILPDSIKKLYFNRLEGFKSLVSYDNVKFKHLSAIELDDVVMADDEVVNGLNLVCPYLESLKILNCSGLKNLHLTGLNLKSIVLMQSSLKTLKIESPQHIKNLSIQFNKNLSEVDIINTSIEILCMKFNKNLSRVDITNMNLDSVLELRLYGNFLTQDLFNDFVRKCRFLKILDIDSTENLKTINISMDMLKIISIQNAENLVEIEMTAHVLEIFQLVTTIYTNPPVVSWKFPNMKTKILLVLYTDGIDDWNHYIPNDDKLGIWQDFFGYFSHTEELQLIIPPQFLIWLKRKGSNSPLPRVKNIFYVNVMKRSLAPILHLLESLIFLAPQATTISFNNNGKTKNSDGYDIFSILKIDYGEKEDRETSNYQSEFLGIEAWLLSVSKVMVEKYHGHEYDWKEFIRFFGKIKNLELVLPEKKNVKFVD